MTKGIAEEQHLFTQNWLIQRHSRGIMRIISPTLCHKCMQHASKWQEQWPLSLLLPGWSWGSASWEADRQTGSYSEVWILEGGTHEPRQQAMALQPADMGHVLGLTLLCITHFVCIRWQIKNTAMTCFCLLFCLVLSYSHLFPKETEGTQCYGSHAFSYRSTHRAYFNRMCSNLKCPKKGI